MPDLLPSTLFADGEEVNEAKLYLRLFTAINTLNNQVQAGMAGDSGWIIPTLGNSWTSFDAGAVYAVPQYRLLNGVVWLHGAMKGGTLSTAAFTLPVGMRPLKTTQFSNGSNGFTCQFTILASGAVEVTAYGSGGSNAFVSLDGAPFIAEQ